MFLPLSFCQSLCTQCICLPRLRHRAFQLRKAFKTFKVYHFQSGLAMGGEREKRRCWDVVRRLTENIKSTNKRRTSFIASHDTHTLCPTVNEEKSCFFPFSFFRKHSKTAGCRCCLHSPLFPHGQLLPPSRLGLRSQKSRLSITGILTDKHTKKPSKRSHFTFCTP